MVTSAYILQHSTYVVHKLHVHVYTCMYDRMLFFCHCIQGLQELGLIEFIGNVMVDIIKTVPLQHQMLVAIILVVWISALSSSFIDNIPFTTATVSCVGHFSGHLGATCPD